MTKSDYTHKPSAFESEIYPSHKSEICTLCISPLQGAKNVCEYLGYLGVKIDDEANNVRGERRIISAPDSKVKVMLIPTNEELAIARETLRLVK